MKHLQRNHDRGQRSHRKQHGIEQVPVARRGDLVDEDLRKHRRGQTQELQRQRDENKSGQRAREPVEGAGDRSKRQGAAQVSGAKIRPRAQFQRYSREARIELFEAKPAAFPRRIEYQGPVLAHGAQHHKVVQLPVQYTGKLEFAKLLYFQSQRPAGQAQTFGRLHQRSKRVPAPRLSRDRTRGRKVQAESMKVGDHRQAGQSALGLLVLRHVAQAPSTANGAVESLLPALQASGPPIE